MVNISQVINNLAQQNMVIDAVGIFFAVWVIWLMVLLHLWQLKKLHRLQRLIPLLSVALGIILAYIMNFIIAAIWFEPRPYDVGSVNLLISQVRFSKSFPSDHAAISFILAYFIYRLNNKWWWIWVAAVLVALARVLVGVHYFHDVLAGAVIGWVLGYLIVWLVNRWVVFKK